MAVVILEKGKSELETHYEFLLDEKNKMHRDIESLNKAKCILETYFEVINNAAKDKLQNDVELLTKEKGELQSDVEFLNEEKAEFVRSAIQEVH
ncbi:hypothetical protein MKW94_014306, partial [Papaver nudicaule]|nr:hypothetical protein [Papaver nudicaule]